MASISSGFAAQQRMHQTARQRTASAPLVMRQSLCRPNGAREVRDVIARPLLEAPEPPTVLALLGIPEPKEMTGYDLRTRN